MRNDLFLKQMGAKIKAERKAQKISVRQLGELCNLDYANISRLESGKQNAYIITLKAIADVLKVDVKDFI